MRQDARHVPGQLSGRRGRPRTTELEVHRYGIGKVLLSEAEPAEPEALRQALQERAGEHIREIYIASKGNILMAFDLSQVEPRVAAYLRMILSSSKVLSRETFTPRTRSGSSTTIPI